MIEPEHPGLSVTQQCALLGLPRSSYYHVPAPEPAENLRLMRVIDETYLAYPFFGSRQLARWLRRQGHDVNRKRVQRLMRLIVHAGERFFSRGKLYIVVTLVLS